MFMDGHFPVTIASKQKEDGTWEASYTSPNGETVAAQDTDQVTAHRLCADKVREGVMKREIHLGR